MKNKQKEMEPNHMDKKVLIDKIKKLKEEKNAVIMAHYYVDGEVQADRKSVV